MDDINFLGIWLYSFVGLHMTTVSHLDCFKNTLLSVPLDPGLSCALKNFYQTVVVVFLRRSPNEYVNNDGFAPVNTFKCHVHSHQEYSCVECVPKGILESDNTSKVVRIDIYYQVLSANNRT